MDRRPISSRETSWAIVLAKKIAGLGISPNMISVLSIFFSLISFYFFYQAIDNHFGYLLLAALFIQLRLLCNLFDGMVAVEYNQVTPMGEVYNDLPDRFSDLFIILGVGYFCRFEPWALELSYITIIISFFTAYIRILGTSMGVPELFIGPMAKQHRMFLLTLCCIIQFCLTYIWVEITVLYYSLFLISFGGILTCLARLRVIKRFKEKE